MPASRDFNGLICPVPANALSERKRQFSELSSLRRFAFRVATLHALVAEKEVRADPVEVFRLSCHSRAKLWHDGRCIIARSYAPVLALCRRRIEAGIDPDRPLHVYRGDTLALVVRSIAEGARLAVGDNRLGHPRFVPFRPRSDGAALHRRQNGAPVTSAHGIASVRISANRSRKERADGERSYTWPGRPDGIWLHSRCEAPWYDSGGAPEV